MLILLFRIIPYQEIIGNYSIHDRYYYEEGIIPYQEIIGNYSEEALENRTVILYHTKK